MKVENLDLLEKLSENGHISLFYGDETGISERGYCPYGWQFKGENVRIPSSHGKRINCFGLISRSNEFHFETTEQRINSDFLITFFDKFSQKIVRKTVVVLDNASIHKSKFFISKSKEWEKKGLFFMYLPPYSPQLNIIERLWLEIKQRWIKPKDYGSFQTLKKAFQNVLTQIGNQFKIKYSTFKKFNYIK